MTAAGNSTGTRDGTRSVHRFLPRYRGLAWSALGIGGGLATFGAIVGASLIPIVGAGFGVVLGAAYLVSPTIRASPFARATKSASASRGATS